MTDKFRFSHATVQQSALTDLRQLIAFVDQLDRDMPKVRRNREIIEPVLHDLIGTFKQALIGERGDLEAIDPDSYFGKARTIIESGFQDPAARSTPYYIVLKQIRDHIGQLGDLIRPYSGNILPDKRQQLLENMLRCISQRLSAPQPPFLLPFLSSEFRYVHFNYVEGNMRIILELPGASGQTLAEVLPKCETGAIQIKLSDRIKAIQSPEDLAEFSFIDSDWIGQCRTCRPWP